MSKVIDALALIQARIRVPKARSAAGRYSYRSLDDICEKLKEPLKETGAVIVLSDEPVEVGGRFYIRATATIKTDDGEIAAVGYAMEEAASGRQSLPQLTGAASSYARKYALAGLLLLDDAKDPDEAEDEQPKTQVRPCAPAGGAASAAGAASTGTAYSGTSTAPGGTGTAYSGTGTAHSGTCTATGGTGIAHSGASTAPGGTRAAQAAGEGALVVRDNSGQARVKLPSGKWAELKSLGAPFLKALIARAEYAPWQETLKTAMERA